MAKKGSTLKEARKTGIESFIEEHEADPPGDMDKLDAALKRPSRETGKSGPAALTQDAPDD